MPKDQIEGKCIYCPSNGPFTAEHMIPAGLGADDRRFMLRNVVCKVCNTTVFSPLELEFLRSSPTAIGRIFMQAEGRKRGSKKNPPKFDAKTKVVITPEGYTAEAEIGFNGKATLLPQLILVDEHKCSVSGSDKNGFGAFISQAQELLGSSIACVSKMTETGRRKFQITTFGWAECGYVTQERSEAEELPDVRIWHSPIEPDANGKYPSNTRLFRRPDNQIVLRLRNDLPLDRALTAFRKVVERLDLTAIQESDIQNPLVSLNFSVQLDVTGRVLAKTGLNMLAYLLGADYVGHPQFQEIKKAIRTGEPLVPPHTEEAKAPFKWFFSGLPDTHHGFLLSAHPSSAGTCGIGLVARLYGSQIEIVSLGHGLPPPPIPLPVVFTVDYNAHMIQQYGLMDYMQSYPIKAQ
ncbi:hypothetical protein [Burkholderia cepacia]|uniref:hypothetical protein n=1 Tax=Burkholderia cepacia TaxID=292 RepID=UPI003528AD32